MRTTIIRFKTMIKRNMSQNRLQIVSKSLQNMSGFSWRTWRLSVEMPSNELQVLSSIRGGCTDAVVMSQVGLNIILFAHEKPTRINKTRWWFSTIPWTPSGFERRAPVLRRWRSGLLSIASSIGYLSYNLHIQSGIFLTFQKVYKNPTSKISTKFAAFSCHSEWSTECSSPKAWWCLRTRHPGTNKSTPAKRPSEGPNSKNPSALGVATLRRFSGHDLIPSTVWCKKRVCLLLLRL